MTYEEVVPFAREIGFHHAGVEWSVEELYCVGAQRPCRNVVLIFHRVLPEEQDAGDGARPAVTLDVEALAPGELPRDPRLGKPPRGLVDALRSAAPGLSARLTRRRRILRELAAKAVPDPRSRGPVPFRRGKKVGRNEPCPCGSGKKFKVCCGQ